MEKTNICDEMDSINQAIQDLKNQIKVLTRKKTNLYYKNKYNNDTEFRQKKLNDVKKRYNNNKDNNEDSESS